MSSNYNLSNANFQRWVVLGRVGHIDDKRYTPNGKPVLRFSLAVDRFWSKSDELQTETVWYRCQISNGWTEKPFEIGDLVMVEGYPQPDPETGGPRVFTRQDGRPGAAYEMFCTCFQIVARKEGNHPMQDLEEDIPF